MRYSGEFQGGLRHGEGELKERNGASIYLGAFQEGLRHGRGKSTDEARSRLRHFD